MTPVTLWGKPSSARLNAFRRLGELPFFECVCENASGNVLMRAYICESVSPLCAAGLMQ